MKRVIIKSRWLFDADGDGRLLENVMVVIANGTIQQILPAAEVSNYDGGQVAKVHVFEKGCLLPGFVDPHVHLMWGTGLRTEGLAATNKSMMRTPMG